MSTKFTIDNGEKWHLYEEGKDETVWLETRGVNFVAGLDSIRVRLPEAAIDAIRNARASSFPHLRENDMSPTIKDADVVCHRSATCHKDEDGCNAHCSPHAKGDGCDVGADDCPPCVPYKRQVLQEEARVS